MTEKLWAEIRAILKRGNDVIIRKKGDGYVVLEDKKTVCCTFQMDEKP